MRPTTRTILSILAVLLTSAVSASAQDSENQTQPDTRLSTEARLWIGQFSPNAHSDFWDSNFQNFTASRDQLDGVIFGGEYVKLLDRHNAFSVGGSFYWSSLNEPARNVLDESGNPLEHHLEINVAAVTASYLLFPAGNDHRLVPYVGAGAGLYFGTMDTFRSSFDSTPDDCEDPSECGSTGHTDERSHTFYTLGYFVEGGLELSMTKHSALLLDGRYTVAHVDLGSNFKPDSELDLSGGQVAAGVSFRF